MGKVKTAAFILLIGIALINAPAETLPLGQTIERVPCRGKDTQSYALHLPKAYTPERPWPMLYCLDPLARGRVPVERFAEGAERTGFIVAGSNNSRNGPREPVREAIFWLVNDTHERLSIDDSKVYAAGFSGGARLALDWGMNGKLAGVAVCGAAFGSNMPGKVPFAIYAAAGVDDFNHHEMYTMSRELARRGVSHRYAEYDGGHAWMPARLATEALEFFAARVPPLAAEESQEAEQQAGKYKRSMREVQEADRSTKKNLLKAFQKQAAKPEDSTERRVARRVLGGTFIGAIEVARPLMDKKEYGAAAEAWNLAVSAQPDQAAPWYSLAVALCAAGDNKRALHAIEQAVTQGFRDRERMIGEPLLEPLRADPRFIRALEAMAR
jgi:dienelactone hydrolase